MPSATLVAPLAHAFGARYDLPVPLWLFVVGGALVVFVSFLLVLPTPVAAGARRAVVDRVGLRPVRVSVGAVSWVVTGALIVAGLFGSQAVAENILPTVFWLLVWVAVPISCGLVGDWTRRVNPYAALARAADHDGLRHVILGGPALRWPRWLGWWPATVLFFTIACGELVYNGTATLPRATALGLIGYAVLTAFMTLLFGAEAWLEHGEVFTVIFGTWGRLGWFRFGAPGSRGLGGGLATGFEASVSRVTFVLLLLVSVTFDGLLATPAWKSFRVRLPGDVAPGSTGYLVGLTAAFLVLSGVAWLLFGGFSLAVRRAGRIGVGPTEAVAGLLPSLLPIAFGYLVAHNLEYVVINGQLLLPLLGNPVGAAWWPHLPYPFNDGYAVNVNLVPSSVVWYGQVALIVAVHVTAVLLAHRHLARSTARVHLAQRAEWPWVAAMVGYTMTSLWLLAQPLVQERTTPASAGGGTSPAVTAPAAPAAPGAPPGS